MRPLKKVNSYRVFCGGTIIAPRKILTAAHCFYNDNKSPCKCNLLKPSRKPLFNLYALAGHLLDGKMAGNGSQWQRINRIAAPNDFDFPRRDIALVFTKGNFTYNEFVKQIPYARDHKTYTDEGVTCVASGYGKTERGVIRGLMSVKLNIISTAQCSKLQHGNMKRFICTLGEMFTKDVSPGDAGSSLVCKKSGHQNEGSNGILVGVISGKRVFKVGKVGNYTNLSSCSFYTRVSTYKLFVDSNKAQIIVPDLTLWISAFGFASEVFFSD